MDLLEQFLQTLISFFDALLLRLYLVFERLDLQGVLVLLLLQSLREEALLLAQDHDLVVQVLLVDVLEFGGQFRVARHAGGCKAHGRLEGSALVVGRRQGRALLLMLEILLS